MSLLSRLIKKLFLVKEIVSKRGDVHFRRYRLLQLPWFAIYIHQICRSDEDTEMHDHPWDFASVILEGSYREAARFPPHYETVRYQQFYSGDVIEHKAEDVHKITLVSKEVWTLVFTSGRDRYWGYRFADGSWIGHKEYRQLKNEGKLR